MEILYSESAIEEYVTYCEREVYSATKKTQNQKIMIKDKKNNIKKSQNMILQSQQR